MFQPLFFTPAFLQPRKQLWPRFICVQTQCVRSEVSRCPRCSGMYILCLRLRSQGLVVTTLAWFISQHLWIVVSESMSRTRPVTGLENSRQIQVLRPQSATRSCNKSLKTIWNLPWVDPWPKTSEISAVLRTLCCSYARPKSQDICHSAQCVYQYHVLKSNP
jgi:hypothetical protein